MRAEVSAIVIVGSEPENAAESIETRLAIHRVDSLVEHAVWTRGDARVGGIVKSETHKIIVD